MSRTSIFVLLLLISSSIGSTATQLPVAAPLHPLDHLTPAEHWQVYDILRASGRAADDMVTMPLQCGTQWDGLGPTRPIMLTDGVVVTASRQKTTEAIFQLAGTIWGGVFLPL